MSKNIFNEYQENKKYHDSKENRIWIATGLYLTFLMISLNWLLTSEKDSIFKDLESYFFPFFTIVFLLTFFYILFQIFNKAISVNNDFLLKNEISKEEKELKDIWKLDINRCKFLKIICSVITEIILLLIIISFSIFVLILFFKKSNIYCFNGYITINNFLFILLLIIIFILGFFFGLIIYNICNFKKNK